MSANAASPASSVMRETDFRFARPRLSRLIPDLRSVVEEESGEMASNGVAEPVDETDPCLIKRLAAASKIWWRRFISFEEILIGNSENSSETNEA